MLGRKPSYAGPCVRERVPENRWNAPPRQRRTPPAALGHRRRYNRLPGGAL